MTYWRMQLHPDDSANAVSHTIKSLGLGYIGLDFRTPPGDLTDVDYKDIPKEQRDYWDFAHKLNLGDYVLIVAHHYPVALVKVASEYNYIRRPEEEIGVWFRHFRKIEIVGYYADFVKNPANWEKNTMTDTISVLNTKTGISFTLIEKWLKSKKV